MPRLLRPTTTAHPAPASSFALSSRSAARDLLQTPWNSSPVTASFSRVICLCRCCPTPLTLAFRFQLSSRQRACLRPDQGPLFDFTPPNPCHTTKIAASVPARFSRSIRVCFCFCLCRCCGFVVIPERSEGSASNALEFASPPFTPPPLTHSAEPTPILCALQAFLCVLRVNLPRLCLPNHHPPPAAPFIHQSHLILAHLQGETFQ